MSWWPADSLIASITTDPQWLSGPIQFSISYHPSDKALSGTVALDAIRAANDSLVEALSPLFHFETEARNSIPSASSIGAGHSFRLFPRWDSPADLDVRHAHFEAMFAVLTGLGCRNSDLLNLVTWALLPLHLAWEADLAVESSNNGGSGWHSLPDWELDLAARHYPAIRAARIKMMRPWLEGRFSTGTPTLRDHEWFSALHAGFPADVAYVGLRAVSGGLGTISETPGTHRAEMVEALAGAGMLRRAGFKDGEEQWVRTPVFTASALSHHYELRMRLPR